LKPNNIYILFGLFFLIAQNLFSQDTDDKYFDIGQYRIYPKEKKVCKETYFEESIIAPDGEISGRAWGYRHDPICEIDFNSTTLLIFSGGGFTFSEQLGITDKKLKNIKFLERSAYGYSSFILKSNDSIFLFRTNIMDRVEKTIFSGLKEVSNDIYQNEKGYYYFLDNNNLFQMVFGNDIDLEVPSLTHIGKGYCLGNDGLYYLQKNYGNRTCRLIKLEDNKESNVQAKVYPYYTIYGNNIYASSNRLDLNISKLKIYKPEANNYKALITDGNKLYEDFSEIELSEPIKERLTGMAIFYLNGDSLYFPGLKKPQTERVVGNLFCKEKAYYLRKSMREFIPCNSVFIFNYPKDKYEKFEVDKYKPLGSPFYLYKGILYGVFSIPVKEQSKINTHKLKVIVSDDVQTNFYHDNNVLIYVNAEQDLDITEDGKYSISKNMIKGVDFRTLQIISRDILIDKNNIYNGTKDSVSVIPRKELGLNIKIIN